MSFADVDTSTRSAFPHLGPKASPGPGPAESKPVAHMTRINQRFGSLSLSIEEALKRLEKLETELMGQPAPNSAAPHGYVRELHQPVGGQVGSIDAHADSIDDTLVRLHMVITRLETLA